MSNSLPRLRDLLFECIDEDGNGMITEDEVRQTRLFTFSDIDWMFEALSRADHAVMCKEEFDSYFYGERVVPKQILEVWKVFERIDVDRNGHITLEELRSKWYVVQNDLDCLDANELDENNIEPWFRRQDSDGNNMMDFAEFCHAVAPAGPGRVPVSRIVGGLQAPLLRPWQHNAVRRFPLEDGAVPRDHCDVDVYELARRTWFEPDPKIAGPNLTWYHVAPPAVALMWKWRPVIWNTIGALVVQPLWTGLIYSTLLKEPSAHDSHQLFFPALRDGVFKDWVMWFPTEARLIPLRIVMLFPGFCASFYLLMVEREVLKYTIVPRQLWLKEFKLFGIFPLPYWIWLYVNFCIAFVSHLDIYIKSALLAEVYILASSDDTSDAFDCIVRYTFGESAWFAPTNGMEFFILYRFCLVLSCLQPLITYAIVSPVGNGKDLDYALQGEKEGYKVLMSYGVWAYHVCKRLLKCKCLRDTPKHNRRFNTWHADTLKFLAQAANFNVVMGAALSEIIERAKYTLTIQHKKGPVHRAYEMVYKELARNVFRYCVTIVWTCPTFCMQTYMAMVIINGSDDVYPQGAFCSVGITLATFTASSFGIMNDTSTCWKFLSDEERQRQITISEDEATKVAKVRFLFGRLWRVAHFFAIVALCFMVVVVFWPAVLSWWNCEKGIWAWGKGARFISGFPFMSLGSCTEEAGIQCNLRAVAHL